MASVRDFLQKAKKYNPINLVTSAATEVGKEGISRVAGGNSYDIRNPLSSSYGTTPNTTAVLGGGSGNVQPAGGSQSPTISLNDLQGSSIYGGAVLGDSATGGGGGNNLGGIQDDIRNKFNTLQTVFDSLFGRIDQSVAQKAQQLGQNYGMQLDELSKAGQKAAETQNMAYGARGLGSSSYLENAQNEAADIVRQNSEALSADQQAKMAELGQYAATTKAGLSAARNQFAPYINQLGSLEASDLANLQSQLGSALSDAQVQEASLLSNPEYIARLNAISPIQQQGSAQLAAKLKNLVTSAAPAQAKKYIAQGLIKAASLNDQNAQNYWQNYFSTLLADSGVEA